MLLEDAVTGAKGEPTGFSGTETSVARTPRALSEEHGKEARARPFRGKSDDR